jgi:hypothetical protein
VKSRLLRPAVILPAAVLLSLGAGIGYAAWERLDTSAVERNEQLLDSLPTFPGADEQDRRSQTFSGEGGLPLPEGLVTTVLYSPPAGATQEEVLDYYVSRLSSWERTTAAVGEAYRVTFTRGDDCVLLLTNGMAPGHIGERTFALSATEEEDACVEPS